MANCASAKETAKSSAVWDDLVETLWVYGNGSPAESDFTSRPSRNSDAESRVNLEIAS